MKTVTILSLLLLVSPVFSELTKEDIRTIMKEENAVLEKRVREYIDLKIEIVNTKIDALEKSVNARIDAVNARIDAVNARIDAVNTRIDVLEKSMNDRFDDVNKKLDWVWYMMIALIGLVTAAIAVPQIIIAYRERGQKDMQFQIDQLRKQIESMQSTPS